MAKRIVGSLVKGGNYLSGNGIRVGCDLAMHWYGICYLL
jgi:hypothetical protein